MSFASSSRAAPRRMALVRTLALVHNLRRLARDRRGASAMEMALIMPILFMLLIGTLEVGRYMFTLESLRSVTAEAARLSMVNAAILNTGIVPGGADITSCTASSTVNLAATRKTPFINSTSLTLCIERTGTTDVTIRVLAQYPYTSFVPYLTAMNGTMTDRTLVIYRVN